jgi:hypothetical protein
MVGSWFVCAQSAIFSAEPCSKNAGETTIVLWITAPEGRIPTYRNSNQIVESVGGFFHQIKVHQPIGRKDSIQTVILTSRRFDSFLYEAAQNFEVVSNIQN